MKKKEKKARQRKIKKRRKKEKNNKEKKVGEKDGGYPPGCMTGMIVGMGTGQRDDPFYGEIGTSLFYGI